MEHLTRETLARLVDEVPNPGKDRHLEECGRCRGELKALRDQVMALRGLPDIVPPPGDWRALERRLIEAGLLRENSEGSPAHGDLDPRTSRRVEGAPTVTMSSRLRSMRTARSLWATAAAAVAVFLGGAFTGVQFGSGSSQTPVADAVLGGATLPSASSLTTPDEALAALRDTEMRYISIRARLEELTASGSSSLFENPYRRIAALEHLAAASQAAVQQAPGDPYFNGLLVSVLGEREATARLVSLSTGEY